MPSRADVLHEEVRRPRRSRPDSLSCTARLVAVHGSSGRRARLVRGGVRGVPLEYTGALASPRRRDGVLAVFGASRGPGQGPERGGAVEKLSDRERQAAVRRSECSAPEPTSQALPRSSERRMIRAWLAIGEGIRGRRPRRWCPPRFSRALASRPRALRSTDDPDLGARGSRREEALLVALRSSRTRLRGHSGDLLRGRQPCGLWEPDLGATRPRRTGSAGRVLPRDRRAGLLPPGAFRPCLGRDRRHLHELGPQGQLYGVQARERSQARPVEGGDRGAAGQKVAA